MKEKFWRCKRHLKAGMLCLALYLFSAFLICANGQSGVGVRMTVTGTVTDTAGNTLQGANVVAEKRTGIATSTDVNGRFVLEVEAGTTLLFSFVGYEQQRFAVSSGRTVINVSLKPQKEGDEVIVVAYGRKQRREALVGSVTSVQPGNLKIPSSNLTTSLAGQVAGIISYQRSGQPGQDNANFFIRGVTTFGYKRDPLILIDNVELSASDLARLQVDDIASFSILKDASATALYGARGANGVILVTTKEGKEGKPRISFRGEHSFSQSNKTIELADPITYMKLYNEATVTRDPLQELPFSPNKILNTQATIDKAPGSNQYVYPAVDWLDMLFKKRTSTQRANMSVSGGGGVAKYFIAGSYNLDNGILKEDKHNNARNNVKYQNYQLRSNINVNLAKRTELILRLWGNFSEYNGPLTADGGFSTDLFNMAMHTSPVLFPAFFPKDSAHSNTKHILFGNIAEADNAIKYNNPYATVLRGHKNSSESRMSAQLELNQKLDFITDGLSFRGMFSTNRYSYFESLSGYAPFYYNISNYDKKTNQYTLRWLNPLPQTGNTPYVAQEYLNYYPGNTWLNTYIYFQGALDYNRTFGDHNVSASLIGTRQQTTYANAPNLLSALPYRNLTVAGRATYSLKGRYFLEYNFGYNGSERFSEDHRFGFFPTIGAGWLVSGEPFFKSNVVNRLKLRGSYGLVGNDAIGSQRFFYVSDVNLQGGGNYATFGFNNGYSRSGVFINNYANPAVTWETSRQANLAMEMTLLKNFNIVAEVYRYDRYNILQQRANIPSSLGLESSISANLGKAQAKGIDLSLDYKQSIGRDFFGAIRGNFTYATNKYTFYEEPQWLESYRYISGQNINRQWGYLAERLFVDDKEAANSPKQIFYSGGKTPKGGDIKYKDLNNDGVLDGADQTFIGYPTVPEIVYGVGFSAGYKGFDLSAFFQGQARVSFFIDPRRTSPFIPSPDNGIGGQTQLLKQYAESHWSSQNQNLYAMYPRLGTKTEDIDNNLQNSTWWLRDGTFLRLKSLEFGYTLPARFSKQLRLNNCRIYFNGLNLSTWSRFSMWDPELSGNGFAYPIQKVFNTGINISL